MDVWTHITPRPCETIPSTTYMLRILSSAEWGGMSLKACRSLRFDVSNRMAPFKLQPLPNSLNIPCNARSYIPLSLFLLLVAVLLLFRRLRRPQSPALTLAVPECHNDTKIAYQPSPASSSHGFKFADSIKGPSAQISGSEIPQREIHSYQAQTGREITVMRHWQQPFSEQRVSSGIRHVDQPEFRRNEAACRSTIPLPIPGDTQTSIRSSPTIDFNPAVSHPSWSGATRGAGVCGHSPRLQNRTVQIFREPQTENPQRWRRRILQYG
jgi:hypothetical protein